MLPALQKPGRRRPTGAPTFRGPSLRGAFWLAYTALIFAVFIAMFWALASHSQVLPPQPYQHVPNGSAPVRYMVMKDVDFACRVRGVASATGHRIDACTTPELIILPDPCEWVWRQDPHDRFARLACHELGHFNGWAADHRGASPSKPGQLSVATTTP